MAAKVLMAATNVRQTYSKARCWVIQQHNLSDRVSFLGFLEQPFPAISATDIVLVCSRLEAWGRVGVDAMLLKRPVVYPRSGGIADYMLDGRTGLSYEPGNVDQLVAQIEKLFDSPHSCRLLVTEAHRYATARFTRDRYGGETYRTLLDVKSKVPGPAAIPSTLIPSLPDAIR